MKTSKRNMPIAAIATGGSLLLAASAACALTCVSNDCANLGYTQSASECSGVKSVRCPFDAGKYFCMKQDEGCSSDYDLDACPEHATCDKCDEKYKIKNCDDGYYRHVYLFTWNGETATKTRTETCKKCDGLIARNGESCPTGYTSTVSAGDEQCCTASIPIDDKISIGDKIDSGLEKDPCPNASEFKNANGTLKQIFYNVEGGSSLGMYQWNTMGVETKVGETCEQFKQRIANCGIEADIQCTFCVCGLGKAKESCNTTTYPGGCGGSTSGSGNVGSISGGGGSGGCISSFEGCGQYCQLHGHKTGENQGALNLTMKVCDDLDLGYWEDVCDCLNY